MKTEGIESTGRRRGGLGWGRLLLNVGDGGGDGLGRKRRAHLGRAQSGGVVEGRLGGVGERAVELDTVAVVAIGAGGREDAKGGQGLVVGVKLRQVRKRLLCLGRPGASARVQELNVMVIKRFVGVGRRVSELGR